MSRVLPWLFLAGSCVSLIACPIGWSPECEQQCSVTEECLDNVCVEMREEDCLDGIDNDEDGVTDCADADCHSQACVEICLDGVDNNADGLIDCADASCATNEPACRAVEICDNQVDDNGDFRTDCYDPACFGTACDEVCTDGQDNDLDGAIDCGDEECSSTLACPERTCDDGLDEDLDGLTDCADTDCESACSETCGDGGRSPLEQCDDGGLEVGDGCDADCRVEVAVFCAELPPLPLGMTSGAMAGANSAFGASCIAPSGPERAYSFTAASEGTLQLQLISEADLALYVKLGCGLQAIELKCRNAAAPGGDEELSVWVPAGNTVTVFVDAVAADEERPYVLNATWQ